MQREQARLRDPGDYAGPCCVRGYVATEGAAAGAGVDRVYKEHAGVRISVARSVAPKVPSIRELILQLNRKQHGDAGRHAARRRPVNNFGSRFSDVLESTRTLPPVETSRSLDIHVGDGPASQAAPGKTQPLSSSPAPLQKQKLPWRLPSNAAAPATHHNLDGLMSIRHMAASGDSAESVDERFPDQQEATDREQDLAKPTLSLTSNAVQDGDGLTSGLLICTTMQQHKIGLPESAIFRNGFFNPPQRRGRPFSPNTFPPNSVSHNGQFAHTKTSTRTNAVDAEPEYPDPVHGASSFFQQRIIEISALESDTIRSERLKAIKKKNKAGSRLD